MLQVWGEIQDEEFVEQEKMLSAATGKSKNFVMKS